MRWVESDVRSSTGMSRRNKGEMIEWREQIERGWTGVGTKSGL